MAASMTGNTLFTTAVKNVFDSWTVLQLAVNHGFGGAESQEKADWMVYAVDQWFKENRNIEPYEMEDFLEDVMNTEFDTIVDDGSLAQIAAMICSYYHLCSEGKEEEVRSKLQLLPKASVQQCSRVAVNEEDEDSDSDTASSNQQDQGRQPVSTTSSQNTTQSQNSTDKQDDNMEVEEDDGWQVVRRGKRK